MILPIVGMAFVVLGLFSGSVLVAAPFGLYGLQPSLALWLFFPAFSVLGLLLVMVGARVAHIRRLTLVASCILLALALASAMGLVLSAASIANAALGTSSLWFVLAVAGVLGCVGAASFGRSTGSDS